MEECKLCSGDIETYGYNDDKLRCEECETIHFEDADYVEVRDAIVEIRMVGDEIGDNREPEFETAKEAKVYIDDDSDREISIINGDVHNSIEIASIRPLDEILVMGMAVSGEIHGTFRGHVDKTRIRVDDEHEYIEMQNGDDFSYLHNRQY